MTACTNHGGKARRVVTAALVGVLSVGTVPMVALAEGVSDAVSPLFATGDEFSKGTISGLKVNGNAVSGSDAEGIPTVQLVKGTTELPLVVTVEKVTPAGSSTAEEVDGVNYRMRVYKADEDGNPTGAPLSGDKILVAGSYVVTVEALSGSKYDGQVYKQLLNVKGADFPDDLTAYENAASDDDFFYTGSELTVDHFEAADGTVLHEGVDYTVTFKKSGKSAELKDAGTYTATLTGLGLYSGSSATCTVEVGKFVINVDTDVVIDPFTDEAPSTPSRIVNLDGTELDPSLVGIEPTTTVSENGKYEFAVSTDDEDNITIGTKAAAGTAGFHGYKVENIASFKYNNSALADSYELDASAGDTFNVKSITGVYGKKTVANADLTITGTKDGVVDSNLEDDLAAGVAGVYKVTVEVADTQVESSGFEYAGTQTFMVTIYKGSIDADATLYVYDVIKADNVAIDSYAKPYDGTAVTTANFKVDGKDSEGNALAAGDLVVKMYDAEGNDVTAAGAVEAGEYTLEVTSDAYKLSGTTTLPITISKVDLTTLEIGKAKQWNDVAGQEYVEYDASLSFNSSSAAISSLQLQFDGGDGTMVQLPGNVDVRVQYNDEGTWKDVGSITDFGSGQYRVVASVADDVAANYVLPEGETSVTIEFTVADKKSFSDVQPSDWYYKTVSDVVELGYMGGYAGTTTFGAEDNLTRAQAVIVLYNMSGTTYSSETENSYDETTGWVTDFSDVDGNAYYAEAVAWAKNMGVVNGNDGKFMPEDEITREQFAAMLCNYAKVVNRDETVDDVDGSALAALPDAGTVSDWAESAVAWAVENGIMGNNGSVMAQNTITRGEVAAMAVNYQPVNKSGSVDVR